ncbi:MAG: Ig-like domain-containing protein [Firmicutes bacterium]|nr:Ig-like domain-containing protein [Bacillota bacterium]
MLFVNLGINTYASGIFEGGDGTIDNPFLIATQEQLAVISDIPTYHFKLLNDITLTGDWVPLCYYDAVFSGSLDGDGFAVKNLSMTSGYTHGGLFAKSDGTIKNLGVEIKIDGSVNASTYLGGLVGHNSGDVINCYAKGNIICESSAIKDAYVGGLIGYNANGNISGCRFVGDVSCTGSRSAAFNRSAGGLIGYLNSGVLDNCYAAGTVTVNITLSRTSGTATYSSKGYSGGLIGYVSQGNIEKCFSTGSVNSVSTSNNTTNYNPKIDSTAYAGGFAGYNGGGNIIDCYSLGDITSNAISNNSTATSTAYTGGFVAYTNKSIKFCYSKGAVESSKSGSQATTYNGGLVGEVETESVITDCYYDIYTSGCSDTGKGIPKTTLGMKLINSYANWDFESTWGITSEMNNGYPYLQWQEISVADIELDQTEVIIAEGESKALNIIITPETATNKDVVWNSSDNTVATVTNGGIVGINAGEAIVTATTVDGGYVASCIATVTERSVSNADYTVLQLNITDTNGNILSEMPTQGSFLAEIEVKKENEMQYNDYFIIAAYNADNVLIDLVFMRAALATEQTVLFGGLLSIPNGQTLGSLKGFVWNSLDTMTPLSNIMKLPQN